MARKGKRQMINNNITKHCIINAALTNNLSEKKKYLVMSGYSRSRFYEMVKKYQTYGKSIFNHKGKENRNAFKHDRINDEINILKIFNDTYYDCNFRDFVRYLKFNEGYDWTYYSYVYNLLTKYNKISPDARKKTVKERKKKEKNENRIRIVPQDPKERAKENIHIAKNRTNRKGHIVEADACFGNFIDVDGQEWALHGYIDQATCEVLALWFDYGETTQGYFNALDIVLKKHGVFEVLRTDKRSIFWSEKKESSPEDSKIQFMFVANTLGIDVQSSIMPQSKPRIERLWRSIRNNIKPFLRLRNVKTIEQANSVLNEFTNYLNEKVLTLHIDFTLNSFEKFTGNTNIILGYKTILKVGKDLAITFRKKKYFICDFTTPINIPRKEIMLIEGRDGKLYGSYQSCYYNIIEINDDILYKSKQILEKENNHNKTPIKPKNNAAWAHSNFIFFKKKWSSWVKKHTF